VHHISPACAGQLLHQLGLGRSWVTREAPAIALQIRASSSKVICSAMLQVVRMQSWGIRIIVQESVGGLTTHPATAAGPSG
jgi:hypothetical protein